MVFPILGLMYNKGHLAAYTEYLGMQRDRCVIWLISWKEKNEWQEHPFASKLLRTNDGAIQRSRLLFRIC